MNTNARIGLCALGFFFPTLIYILNFGVFLDMAMIFGGGIIAIIIFFVTRPRSPAPVQQNVYQNIIQGDNITKTGVKDSVLNRSSIGSDGKSKAEQVQNIKELLDSGLIDAAEFQQMKKEILGK